ncbi:MAG: hypothetical protein GY845_02385 [Planctomycetes bacterium]|nr:hypothetical protein [Planctomycetota bacterium]
MNVSPTIVKEAIIQVVDELSPERRTELLEFALFIKARQQQPIQLKADMEKLISQLQAKEAQPPQLLHNSVLRYDDPFAPVAEADWESLQ